MINALELIERVKYVLDVKTQSDIAIYFDVSSKTVSEWKNGNSSVPYHRLMDLSEEKGISLNWLFYGVGQMVLSDASVDFKNLNSKSILLNRVLTEPQKVQVRTVADYMIYAPPYFIAKVVERLDHFKSECSEGFMS